MENTREFKLEVVTPQAVFYSDYADMVEMKTTEGEMGVYKGHIPLTAVVAPGTLRIHKDNEVKEAVLLDGIIRVLEDSVTILAEACEWADEIDLARAMEAKIRAERRLKGPRCASGCSCRRNTAATAAAETKTEMSCPKRP